ncbi:MAG TPA: MFS transporter [Pseudonocardiaceae bacterium]|nr:MFS transporter [Pseudonocardiaceae bacterium]
MTTPTHPRLALFAICLGFAMITLDATIVTVALPAIQRSLGGSLTGLQWVVDAYTVALAAVLLSAGTAADRFGARAVYLTGLSGFVLASVACVLAPELPVLVAARAAQGLGAAGLIPPSLTLIVHMFPDPARRTWALGIWGGTSGIGLSAGPVLGGLAVSGIGWQAVFLANIPIGLAALALTKLTVPDSPKRPGERLDLLGQATGILALGLLTGGLIQASRAGWTDPAVLVLLGGGRTLTLHVALSVVAVTYLVAGGLAVVATMPRQNSRRRVHSSELCR